MEQIILNIINQFGYIGVFILIMIENIFPPIPSEVILTFGGFLTTYTGMKVWGVVISATLASVIGGIILYLIGLILNAERIIKLCDSKIGRLLHLEKEDVRKAEKWFLKHGNKTVFLCRFVPIVRSLISIPAGISKMRIIPFVSLTAIGTFIWNVILVFLGKIAGNTWKSIAGYVDVYAKVALVILVLISVAGSVIFIKKRVLNKKYK